MDIRDIRLGNGLDFHRLILDSHRPLILGGARIESEYALEGHSDADIILHALADAMFGALAGPDIGELFPDTDPALKNMDSTRIIETALSFVRERDFSIANVDITIIGERPKIRPHKTLIRKSLGQLLNVNEDRIGIKATTTEKMGFPGRGEGLGCLATALLIKH
jgi:2-C-methyl-D-erythritol 2,4-cyclodiphosphate synthase